MANGKKLDFEEIHKILRELAENHKRFEKRFNMEVEMRKKEEARRRKEEEIRKKEEARRRKEEARKRKEEEIRKKEEEIRRKKEEAKRKEEEAIRKEEEKQWRKEQKERDERLDKSYERTERQIFGLDGKHAQAWGNFSETCIKEGAIEAFNSVGLPIDHYYVNEKAAYENIQHPEQSKSWEFDIIAFSHEHKIAIPTEVKTTLARSHINDFIKKLKRFLHLIGDQSKYKGLDNGGQSLCKLLYGKKIYGAVGYVNLHKKEKRGIIQYAQDRGLLVLSATKDSAKVVTPPEFQPALFEIPSL